MSETFSMTDQVLKNCPACGHTLEAKTKTRGDWTEYTCPKHGGFALSNTLSVTLIRNPKYNENVKQYLEKEFIRKEVICTTDVGLA